MYDDANAGVGIRCVARLKILLKFVMLRESRVMAARYETRGGEQRLG